MEQQTITGAAFSTLKAAREAGFREPATDEYGGERIELKGRILLRGAARAKSATEWGRAGLRVKDGETPHCHLRGRFGDYGVYRDDQVELKESSSPEKRDVRQAAAKKRQETKALNQAIRIRRVRIARTEHQKRCERIGINPDGRAAEWLEEGMIDEDLAELIGFKARYRHKFTDYDQQFQSDDFEHRFDFYDDARDAARELRDEARARKTEQQIPNNWNHYLGKYGFQSDVANAMARVLRDPEKCHPCWFKEAEIAVRRSKTALDAITYEVIAKAVETWRSEQQRW